MDRSFLFQPEVITASRQFVCIRLITYENESEMAFLKSVTRTRSGEVENSSFSIFAPDGKTKLTSAGRGIHGTYANPPAMAEGMSKLLKGYHPTGEPSTLPLAADVRLGLDIAASDLQPLVVVFAESEVKRKDIEASVAQFAWGKEFIGRFIFASTSNKKELMNLEGVKTDSAVLVIKPDKFGLTGKVLAQTEGHTAEKVQAALQAGGRAFVRDDKVFQSHVREGKSQGIFWETKTPVTDPGEASARERSKRK
jgi:hypothetical protein